MAKAGWPEAGWPVLRWPEAWVVKKGWAGAWYHRYPQPEAEWIGASQVAREPQAKRRGRERFLYSENLYSSWYGVKKLHFEWLVKVAPAFPAGT